MMKNTITTFILLFITFSAFAQKEKAQDLEKFTAIKAYDRIVVTLVKSTKIKLFSLAMTKMKLVSQTKMGC